MVSVLISGLFGLGVWAVAPQGADVRTTGQIKSILLLDGKRRGPMAVIEVDGREAYVDLPRPYFCRVGDRVPLMRRTSRLRTQYLLPTGACAMWVDRRTAGH